MGLKDSLSSFGEFVAISKTPDFRSKTSLNSVESTYSTNGNVNILDLKNLPPLDANRRHSLNIICGTDDDPQQCIHPRSFSVASQLRKNPASFTSVKDEILGPKEVAAGRQKEDNRSQTPQTPNFEASAGENNGHQEAQRRASEPLAPPKPGYFFSFGSARRRARAKRSSESRASESSPRLPSMMIEIEPPPVEGGRASSRPPLTPNEQEVPRTPRSPLYKFTFSAPPIQEDWEAENAAPHTSSSSALPVVAATATDNSRIVKTKTMAGLKTLTIPQQIQQQHHNNTNNKLVTKI